MAARMWNPNRYGEAPVGAKLRRDDLIRIGRYLLPEWRPSPLILGCIVITSILGWCRRI